MNLIIRPEFWKFARFYESLLKFYGRLPILGARD